MSENQSGTNRIVTYLLGVIVLLLVVLVAVVYARQQATPQVATGTGEPTVASSATANPGVGSSTTGFDKSTATKVPAGTTPKAYVQKYYQSILDKKFDVAFKMQPATSQQGGTVDQFQQTQTMYGMKSFKIASEKIEGENATVQVEQDLGQNGIFGTTWTFVKDGSSWLVKERKVQIGAAQ